jgi:hypothetical protein
MMLRCGDTIKWARDILPYIPRTFEPILLYPYALIRKYWLTQSLLQFVNRYLGIKAETFEEKLAIRAFVE